LLNAPRLHQLLNHPPLQPYIYGGKGVGSQGDGTAQLVARDQASQAKAMKIIKRDFPSMQCYEMKIAKTQ
jgi:galactokinase